MEEGVTTTQEELNTWKTKTYVENSQTLTCEITLHVAQIVNTE